MPIITLTKQGIMNDKICAPKRGVGAPEMVDAAVELAFAELQRQLPRTIDLSGDRTAVLPFDGFDLRAVIEAALANLKFS
jgi:hypothetical protein